MEADELLLLVAGGDQKAFEELYGLVSGPVFGLVRRVVRDPAQSEEVAQEVLLELWRSAAKFDPGRGSALSWILTLAHRRAVDRVRSARAAGEREQREAWRAHHPAFDQVTEEVEAGLEREWVRRCLDRLTALQRQSVTLAYYEGYTYREVAERLSLPLGTVKTRMRDGLTRLRECLGGSGMSLFRREDLHSLAAPYALDALEPAERVRFEKHLKDCDRCAAEVRALSEDAVRLAWSAAAPAPAALRDRVMAAVLTTPQDPVPQGRHASRHARVRRSCRRTCGAPSRRRDSACGAGSRCSCRSPRPPPPRPSSSPRCSPSRRTGPRTSWTAEQDRSREIAHVLAAPDARATQRPGRAGPDHRSGRFRFGGERGGHPRRIRRPRRAAECTSCGSCARTRNHAPSGSSRATRPWSRPVSTRRRRHWP